MFLISLEPNNQESFGYGPAFQIAGTEAELLQARRQITALTLAGLGSKAIKLGDADDLLRQVWYNSEDIDVNAAAGKTFMQIVRGSGELARERRKQLLAFGKQGKLGALTISDELQLLDDYRGAPLQDGGGTGKEGGVVHILDDGLEGAFFFGSASMRVRAYEVSDLIADDVLADWKVAIIKSLPHPEFVTHEATMYEIGDRNARGPRQISYHTHSSLGYLDPQGNYVAFTTILARS